MSCLTTAPTFLSYFYYSFNFDTFLTIKNKNIVQTPYLHTCEFVLCNHLKIDISTAAYCSVLNSNSNKSIHSTQQHSSFKTILARSSDQSDHIRSLKICFFINAKCFLWSMQKLKYVAQKMPDL